MASIEKIERWLAVRNAETERIKDKADIPTKEMAIGGNRGKNPFTDPIHKHQRRG